MNGLTRRTVLASGAAALAACERPPSWAGGWVGDAVALGHRLRDEPPAARPATQRRVALLVLGAGVAGLAAARAAVQSGIDDVAVLDLHAVAGGNSRGHRVAGAPCPLGAHYLPLPGPQAHEVFAWLHEIGVARQESGRTVYDERHLCHSPQERLFIDGAWHEGLLPPVEAGSATQAQYRAFAREVGRVQSELRFALPTHRAPWTPGHAALDAQTFAQWLNARGLTDARLRWFLDYCCRDDFGADAATVSAWAGLHYFASRHGFHAPGDEQGERDAVLTWPEGNAWLVQRLAAPLSDRLQFGRLVQRVVVERHQVAVDVLDAVSQRVERWSAPHVVVALPLFVAARVVETPSEALAASAAGLRYAPWLVANLRLRRPLLDRPGMLPAWDNVSYGSAGLGYVNAQHQSLVPTGGSTLITAYHALPEADRAALLDRPWQHWAQRVIDDLTRTHPDLPSQCEQIDLARHGHAMSIPAPGIRGHAALRTLAEGEASSRLHFAHADLAGYSVFEEAFTLGDAAGRRAARLRRG